VLFLTRRVCKAVPGTITKAIANPAFEASTTEVQHFAKQRIGKKSRSIN